MDQITKAIVAGVIGFGSLYEFATTAQSMGGEVVTTNEWVRIVVSAVVAAVGVWAVPNVKKQ